MQKNKVLPKRKLIEIDETILSQLKRKGVHILVLINQMNRTISKVVKDAPKGYNESYSTFCEYILQGYPEGVNIIFAAESKSLLNEFNQVKKDYDQIKQYEKTDSPYFKYIELVENHHQFSDNIQAWYNQEAGIYLEGEALKLYEETKNFYDLYQKLYSKTENRIYSNRLLLPQIMPLFTVHYGKIEFDLNAIKQIAGL